MSAKPKVSIFWDGDSARPKSTLGGFDVVKAIRALAGKLGVIKSLRLYVDIVGGGPNRRFPAALASELQCSGVTIVDTVSGGRHGGPSKMLMTDLFLQAMDSTEDDDEHQTALVVTADPDVGYALSLLRGRGHSVVLLCPSGTNSNLLKLDPASSLEGDMLESLSLTPVVPSHRRTGSNATSTRGGPALSDGGRGQTDSRDSEPTRRQIRNAQGSASPSSEVQTRLGEYQQREPIASSHLPVVTELARAFIACAYAVQLCTDNGRRRCASFMELPDKRIYPDYYQSIPEPICINHILGKIDRGVYQDAREFEADWALFFRNARFYYPRESQCLEDAAAMELAFREAFGSHFGKADVLPDAGSSSGSSDSAQLEEGQTATSFSSPEIDTRPSLATFSTSTSATLQILDQDAITPTQASSAAHVDSEKVVHLPLSPSPPSAFPSEIDPKMSLAELPIHSSGNESSNSLPDDSPSALATPAPTLLAFDTDATLPSKLSTDGQAPSPKLTWAMIARRANDLEEEQEIPVATSDGIPGIPGVPTPASASSSPSVPSAPSSGFSFLVPSSLPAEDLPPLLSITPSTSVLSKPASTPIAAALVDPPPHTIEEFVPLLAYLRIQFRSRVTVYHRSLLIDELRAQKADIFPAGPPACLRTYVKDGLSLGVLRIVTGNTNQVELSPAFRSADGTVPSEYVTLVDFFRDRKAFGGTPKIDRAELQKELLKRQSDIFIKANTAHFKKPVKLYVRKAAELQIVNIDVYDRISLHPNYMQG